MRNVLLSAGLALALSACGNLGDGRDHVAEGTRVYDGGKIVRWTGPGESFSANVRPGHPYVSCGGGCVETNR